MTSRSWHTGSRRQANDTSACIFAGPLCFLVPVQRCRTQIAISLIEMAVSRHSLASSDS